MASAGRLPPEVVSGLRGISDVARALNAPGSLDDVAGRALAAMCSVLALEAAVLYLPDPSGRPLLRRFLGCAPGLERSTHEVIDFDPEAWRLAVAGRHPLIFNEPAGWLVDNPFEPPASRWLVLPLASERAVAGVVVAARAEPLGLDPLQAIVLSLLGEQLAAGIVAAQLRLQLQRGAIESERLRVAADVHDGLAQDLALAMRELAFLDGSPAGDEARASGERLRAAVASANATVRARLVDLSASMPIGGVRSAVEDLCGRFSRRGPPVRASFALEGPEPAPDVTAAIVRVLNEALANAARHAGASRVDVRLEAGEGSIAIEVADDGGGFAPEEVRDGGLGLGLMCARVAEAAGELTVASHPGRGTTISARFPLHA
ncbi:MAG: sensor histidine kinase [Solirubrobacteraceae bacterium]